jgi:hypothetical protein
MIYHIEDHITDIVHKHMKRIDKMREMSMKLKKKERINYDINMRPKNHSKKQKNKDHIE